MSRDFQRERIYEAERTVNEMMKRAHEFPMARIGGSLIAVPEMVRFGSLDALAAFIKRVEALPFYAERWPGLTPITVRHRKSGQRAHYERGTATVAFHESTKRTDQYAMHALYALHEMAHHVSPSGSCHGAEFAANLLVLVREVLGHEAHFLLHHTYTQTGVKIDYKALV